MSTAPPVPHDVDAERTLLGAVLVAPEVLAEAQGAIHETDFYLEAHRTVWAAIARLSEAQRPIDLVTLSDELGRRGQLVAVGGPTYVAALIDGVPRLPSVVDWCSIIRRHAQLRSILALARKVASAAYEQQEPDEIVASADAALLEIGARANEGKGVLDNRELVREALASIDERITAAGGVVGYRTGLTELDQILQGIRKARLGVIAARLGNGKSMLALTVAAKIADQSDGKAVLFVSLEMGGAELMERRLAAASSVNPATLWRARGESVGERHERVVRAAVPLMKSTLRIIEDAWTVTEIAQHARMLRSREGLAAVFVDYFQLLTAVPAQGKRFESRVAELASISHALRKLCKQLDVPIVVVAQLNREAADKRGKHKAPEIHEIEGSDALGKDAHWCVMIDPEPPPINESRGMADLYVRKNRGGIKGRCRVRFRGEFARFEDAEYQPADAQIPPGDR